MVRWPVIGREPELTRIADARAAGARAIVVQAPAGVGKSRLAREALARAERDGVYTAWAQGTRSAAMVPLGAFAGVVSVEVRSEDRFELLQRTAGALREPAGKRGLVIGVDDGQLLDSTSAALVLHLAASAAAFVVATVRSDEPCPEAIVSLWNDLEAPRLELGRLGEMDTGRLLDAMLDAPAEQRVAERVWATSRGNPMYIRGLVLGALAGGALERMSGLWRVRAPLPISRSPAEMISARVAGLGDGERETLQLLALGEPLPVSELADLVGSRSLAGAEERGLIAIEGCGRLAKARLAHPLYGEAVRAALGAVRGRRIRLRLAGIVQARRHLTPDLALRVARWLLDAGERVPALRLLDAARAANLNGDPELGGQLAQQAVEAGAGLDAALAHRRLVQGRFADARRWLAEAQLHQEQHDPIGLLAITSAMQAWRAACMHDGATADAALARCRAASRGSDPHGVRRRALQALAWGAVAHRETAQARRILIDAAAEHGEFPVYATRFLYEAMRAGVTPRGAQRHEAAAVRRRAR